MKIEDKSGPTVSVVIPSFERHNEVVRAATTSLNQTLSPLEVIVVNDGSDSEKGRLLGELDDERLHFLEAPRRANASATRNYAIRYAKADWIALLDDDDEWRPEKLETQFRTLANSGEREAVLAGVETVFSGDKQSHVRPSRPVPADVPVDQVLFCGYGGVHTSTLIAPKWVFIRYPFDESIERHEDWSWLLQVGRELPLLVASEIVCERRLTPGEGLSRPGGYAFSRSWYENNRELMSPIARASFVANILSRKAAYDREIGVLSWLASETRRNGGLNRRNLARLFVPWLVPTRVRQAIKTKIVSS